ncbi:Uncharacterised protein [Listeria grayi]|uniref:Uncharacterized protein n=1 Tax=Listeria grayi FSL F6-1183 TaxID=1265827 RepID=A0A829R613_LISGR|nr:hypothetical protein [Listeria grayi]EUJ26630.1 hypothetical protein LMUR_12496 [Listeria grayi FSL F6-1183]VEI35935.1 Uncharacterised protein [Listeria grayi]
MKRMITGFIVIVILCVGVSGYYLVQDSQIKQDKEKLEQQLKHSQKKEKELTRKNKRLKLETSGKQADQQKGKAALKTIHQQHEILEFNQKMLQVLYTYADISAREKALQSLSSKTLQEKLAKAKSDTPNKANEVKSKLQDYQSYLYQQDSTHFVVYNEVNSELETAGRQQAMKGYVKVSITINGRTKRIDNLEFVDQ